jgi:hypothetical protein
MQPLSPRGQLVIRYADALIRDRNAYFDELAVWKYRVHSTMFVASATILTLVCSLGRPISGNPGGIHACYPDCTYWISIATVLLNGICLLALSAALYQNIRATSQVMHRIEERFDDLKETLLIPADDALIVDGECKIISRVEISRFFSVCEMVAYISFILMVIGLVFRYCFVQP